jgi:glycosyltransferase involved in cell wall biosynthesis
MSVRVCPHQASGNPPDIGGGSDGDFAFSGDFEDRVIDVTIGLAAYKGAATLEQALDSLLAQTYPHFIIIVSDNCSPDGAGEICARYALKDNRVRHIKRSETVSAAENYRVLLAEAQTPYFMWAAADDVWAPGFLESNCNFLGDNPDFVLSQSRVLFRSQGMPTRLATGTSALCDTPSRNIRRFFRNPSDNSRFYGVWRTRQLQESYPADDVYGFDWLASGVTLKHGKHHQMRSINMLRDETPAQHYTDAVAQYEDGPLAGFLPILALTRYIIVKRPVPLSPGLLWSLFRLNIAISLRFSSLRLYVVMQNRLGRPEASSPLSARLAQVIASIFAPGMRERRTDWVAQARRRIGMSHQGQHDRLGTRLTHGWRSLPPVNQRTAAPDASIVVIAQDALDDTLLVLHHIADVIDGNATEAIIVDNASVDATGLLLKSRNDLVLVSLAERVSFEQAMAAGASRASTSRIAVIDPAKWLKAGSVEDLRAFLAHLRSSAQDAGLELPGGTGLHIPPAPQPMVAGNIEALDPGLNTAALVRPKNVMFLYWGRRGLSQFSSEVALAAAQDPGFRVTMSVSAQNEELELFSTFGQSLMTMDLFERGIGALIGLWRIPGLRRMLAKRLRDDRIEAIVTLMPHVWLPLVANVGKRLGVRQYLMVHDAVAHPGDPTGLVNGLKLRGIAHADRIITLSSAVTNQLVSSGKVDAKRISTLFHPHLMSATRRPAEPVSPFGGNAAGRLLFMGRIQAYKGLPLLIDTLEYLGVGGLKFELTVMGEGSVGVEPARLTNLSATVVNRWLTAAEIAEALDSHDVIILPYLEASQSGIVAMAHGRGVPVIVTPVGGLQEQVVDGVTGVVADAVTPQALGAAIRRIFETPGLLESIRRNIDEGASHRDAASFVRSLHDIISADDV